MRFLIVDDDELNLKYLRAVLSPYAECVEASSGKDTIALFREDISRGSLFDAVFMDIMMPETDGHATVRELRDIEKESGVAFDLQFKLVMVSALSDVKNVTQSFFKGMADLYLTKPVAPDTIISELKRNGLLK